jgi:hypothetical protein
MNLPKPVAFLQILVCVSDGSAVQDLGLYPESGSVADAALRFAISNHNTITNPADLYPEDLEMLSKVDGWNGGKPQRHTGEGMVQTLQVIPAALPTTAGFTDDAWEALADFPGCGSWEEVAARREARDYKTASANDYSPDELEEFKSRAINAAQDWADFADDPQAEYTRICAMLGIPER